MAKNILLVALVAMKHVEKVEVSVFFVRKRLL